MLRSVIAVIAGYLTSVVLVIATFAVMGFLMPNVFPVVGEEPTLGLMLWTLTFSVVYAGVSGYVTARIAKIQKRRHSMALGILMVVLGLLMFLSGGSQEPLWWSIILLILVIPATTFGGVLCERSKR